MEKKIRDILGQHVSGTYEAKQKVVEEILILFSVRRSICCNSDVYCAPTYYNTTMKTNDGKDIPLETVCLECGCRCSIRLF